MVPPTNSGNFYRVTLCTAKKHKDFGEISHFLGFVITQFGGVITKCTHRKSDKFTWLTCLSRGPRVVDITQDRLTKGYQMLAPRIIDIKADIDVTGL